VVTDARSRRAVSRLEELVGVETPTGHSEGLAAAHRLLRAWIEPVAGPAEIEEVDGVAHLLWRGGDAPKVLLLGHLDTVFPLGTVAERPFALAGDRATGPGIFDMKAGAVIMAEVLAAVAHPGEVSVLLTGDEETGSITSRALVEREARRAGRVLLLEPSLDGAVKTARRGGSFYRIDVVGRAAHAGLEPELGRSALVEHAHQVLAVRGLADDVTGTTVNPTVARAGTVTNAIPSHAELHLDVRAWTMDELDRVHLALNSLVAHTPDVTVHVTGGVNRPPMEDAASRELLALVRDVARRRGLASVDAVSAGGASDGNFSAALGVQTLDGLGPLGGGAHATDEWVSIASLRERIELLTGVVDALARSAPAGRVPLDALE
jgi:glutamate carboxypeptidase